VADTEKPVEKSPEAGSATSPSTKAEAPVAENRQRKDRRAGKKVAAGVNAVRSRIASVVWLVAVVCALFLAIGALLIALKANQGNAIVTFVLDGADRLDLGVFSRKDGIFTFTGKSAATKNALVNWGIGAIAYLIVGKVLDRIIRP
jgi:hypothetical protein